MASLRKKYQQQVENPPRDNDDAPVAASPRPSAAAPPPAVEHPEPPALEEERPEEAAAKSAIQERLREMTEAEAHARQPVEQPRAAEPPQHSPPRTTEEQFEQAISRFPTRIQQWCRKDPRLLHDPERIAEAQYLHHVVCREVGGEGSDEYYNRMETRLGLTPRAQSVSPPRAPTPRPAPQRFTSQPPAAPPTREVPSMRPGRPPSDSMRPTALDHEGARIAGIDIQSIEEPHARPTAGPEREAAPRGCASRGSAASNPLIA